MHIVRKNAMPRHMTWPRLSSRRPYLLLHRVVLHVAGHLLLDHGAVLHLADRRDEVWGGGEAHRVQSNLGLNYQCMDIHRQAGLGSRVSVNPQEGHACKLDSVE
jgi:hypothetical protein